MGRNAARSEKRQARSILEQKKASRGDAEKEKEPRNGDYGTKYNREAVSKEIGKDKRIKGKEAKMVHALLRGRGE